MIGETAIKPTDHIDVSCEIQRSIGVSEIKAIVDRAMFGFFGFGLIYGDAIGFSRTSNTTFLLRPTGQFVQASSFESINEDITAEQQNQNQRALVGTLLQIETENERKRALNAPR